MQHIIDSLPIFSCNNDAVQNSSIADLQHNNCTNHNNNNTIFYHLVGNFIPPEWRNLTASNGKSLSKTARQLLSLIVSCLEIDNYGNSGELQEGYYFFEQQLGLCQRRVRQCLLELEQGGFICIDLKTMIKNYSRCRNILFIRLVRKFQAYSQKISAEPERNFDSSRNNFQPHYIDIDNKKNISKSRYSQSNFFENEFEEEVDQSQLAQNVQTEEITLSEIGTHKDNISEITVVLTATDELKTLSPNEPLESSWIGKITDKAKRWCAGKKLEEFYPLSEEDGSTLQLRSNRDFNLSYINKLLLKLAAQYPDHRFYNKKAVLNYMTKALMYELRETTLVNNENFNFKVSCEIKVKEDYLQQLESSRNTDQRTQLRRKIAAIFHRDTAYELLTGCCFAGVIDDQYRLELVQQMNLSEQVKIAVLQQVQAVYGSKVQQLQLIQCRQAKLVQQVPTTDQAKMPYSSLSQLNPQSVWYKVRRYLIDCYGSAIDQSWFSKLELIEEDNTNRKITLKPSTPLIEEWIKQNYLIAFSRAFAAQDFTFEVMPVADKRFYVR